MKVSLVLCFFMAAITCSYAQYVMSDIDLLNLKSTEKAPIREKRKLNLNPLHLMYEASIGIYQKHISSQIGANCIYEVTCSRFSRQLVAEFGVTKGFFLSLDRVGRCNKLSFMETPPTRLNPLGKVVEHLQDYHLH